MSTQKTPIQRSQGGSVWSMDSLSSRMASLLRADPLAPNGNSFELFTAPDWSPRCDVLEDEERYEIRAELPDVTREDVSVSVEGDSLTIRGERRRDSEQRGVRFHRREVERGLFVRRFHVPENADGSRVEATFRDGMLTVSLPKISTEASGGEGVRRVPIG